MPDVSGGNANTNLLTKPPPLSECNERRWGRVHNRRILDEEGWLTVAYDFKGIIYGYAGSAAQTYAEAYDANFQRIDAVYAVPGDMDGDGESSVLDAVILQKYLLGRRILSKSAWEYADLNQDGVVNIYDLLILKRNLLNN